VLDVVAALRAASGHAGVYNIGTGIETDVSALYAGLAEAAGSTAQPVFADLRPGELRRSCLTPPTPAVSWAGPDRSPTASRHVRGDGRRLRTAA
jgi:nucleoside-diphosphate-sugar epimerase